MMQTVETPSEQPEREYSESMPIINQQALLGNGFYIMRRMYREPFIALISFSTGAGHHQWVNKVAELCSLGYVSVASTGDGFQLTANGRLLFHNYYEEYKQAAQEAAQNSFFWSNYTPDELAMLYYSFGNEPLPFDLLDF